MPENMQNPLPFVSFSQAAGAGRARGSPGQSPLAEFRHSRMAKLSRGGCPRDGGRDGWRQCATWGRGLGWLHSPEKGGILQPQGGAHQGQVPCPSAGHKPNQEESEQSSLAHPSAERQGGGGTQAEERHCGRGAAVSGARLEMLPKQHPQPFPHPGAWWVGLAPLPINVTQPHPWVDARG